MTDTCKHGVNRDTGGCNDCAREAGFRFTTYRTKTDTGFGWAMPVTCTICERVDPVTGELLEPRSPELEDAIARGQE